nr:MAG TPA: hypothetical protein [Caudoviricetes sp.]
MKRFYATTPRKIFYERSTMDKMLKELLSGEFDNLEYTKIRKKTKIEVERQDNFVRFFKITKYPKIWTMIKSSFIRFMED